MGHDSKRTGQTHIRAAGPEDAAAIAAVHVASWRETYAGLLPQAMLDGLSVTERTERWDRILSNVSNPRDAFVFIAEHDGEAVGFASCSEQRDETLRLGGFTGEFTAIYVLKRAQREGLGSRLMRTVARALCDQGHKAASLWVLHDNHPAREFYGRLGGVARAEKEDRRGAITLVELAYVWSDLSVLLKSLNSIASSRND